MPKLIFTASSFALIVLFGVGCAKDTHESIDLMPAPDVFGAGKLDPFEDGRSVSDFPSVGMLYATDRAPDPEGMATRPYGSERGHLIRLGRADVQMGDMDITWEEAREISLLKNRSDRYPLSIAGVEEFGLLEESFTPFTPVELRHRDNRTAMGRYAEVINGKIAESRCKDIFVYVPGYFVTFENPLMVAAEMWHFMGYEGVFVAYSWPATPKRFAYFADIETAEAAARNLRVYLEALAAHTEAEQIHVVGYSAGTRLVARVLEQLALKYDGFERAEVRAKLRLGNVIFIGSDMDRQAFGMYIADGILNVADNVTVYVSEKDKALRFSRRLFSRDRLGEMWEPGALSAEAVRYLGEHDNIDMINVTEAQQSSTENGHRYLRKSPWVSSDLLTTLRYSLSPEERGLVRAGRDVEYDFPPDYIERLREGIRERRRAP
jgi:esterase/lipase superfamily enzyme